MRNFTPSLLALIAAVTTGWLGYEQLFGMSTLSGLMLLTLAATTLLTSLVKLRRMRMAEFRNAMSVYADRQISQQFGPLPSFDVPSTIG